MRSLEQFLLRRPIVSRSLALLLLVFALQLGWILAVVPLKAFIGSQARWRVEVRQELARARGRAALEPLLKQRLADLPGAPSWQRFLTVGQADDADASLRRTLTAIAAASGGTVQSLTPIRTSTEGVLRKYGVQLTASLTVDQLKSLLVNLRARPEYLRIEHLAISAPQVQQPNNNPGLLVKMDVFAYATPALAARS